MCPSTFQKVMTTMKRNNLIRWILLSVLILLVARPAWTQSASGVGAGIQKFTKNKIDYEVVSFDRLFFHYQPPVDVEHPDGNITKGTKKPMPIPPEIKALNGKKVAIKGFIIPLTNSGQNINQFLFADELVTCMFCAMLSYDQWMTGTVVNPKGFHIEDDQYEEPVIVYGTLEVGEEYQDGQFTGIYRIKADGFQANRKKFFGIL